MITNISAFKFKRWCQDNKLTAQEVADVLHLQRSTVYGYWSGSFAVPDENKKKLEEVLGLPIYEIFYNEEIK